MTISHRIAATAAVKTTTYTDPTTRNGRDRGQTVRIGTFADGQRAVPLTATYSAKIGSFGDAARD